jgi:membrane protease YdiL (CAAX protease family)
MHMQFYGFMPRMLLGAFFGYLLCWSGSLWLPIIMHALNNSLYIIEEWSAGGNEASINTFGAENMPAVAVSIVLTIAGLYTLRKSLISKH